MPGYPFFYAYTRAKLAIELKGLFAAKAKENQVRKPESVLQISAKQKIDTRQELARIAGTSHDTIAGTCLDGYPLFLRKRYANVVFTARMYKLL